MSDGGRDPKAPLRPIARPFGGMRAARPLTRPAQPPAPVVAAAPAAPTAPVASDARVSPESLHEATSSAAGTADTRAYEYDALVSEAPAVESGPEATESGALTDSVGEPTESATAHGMGQGARFSDDEQLPAIDAFLRDGSDATPSGADVHTVADSTDAAFGDATDERSTPALASSRDEVLEPEHVDPIVSATVADHVDPAADSDTAAERRAADALADEDSWAGLAGWAGDEIVVARATPASSAPIGDQEDPFGWYAETATQAEPAPEAALEPAVADAESPAAVELELPRAFDEPTTEVHLAVEELHVDALHVDALHVHELHVDGEVSPEGALTSVAAPEVESDASDIDAHAGAPASAALTSTSDAGDVATLAETEAQIDVEAQPEQTDDATAVAAVDAPATETYAEPAAEIVNDAGGTEVESASSPTPFDGSAITDIAEVDEHATATPHENVVAGSAESDDDASSISARDGYPVSPVSIYAPETAAEWESSAGPTLDGVGSADADRSVPLASVDAHAHSPSPVAEEPSAHAAALERIARDIREGRLSLPSAAAGAPPAALLATVLASILGAPASGAPAGE